MTIRYSNGKRRGWLAAFSGPGERPPGEWPFCYNLGYGYFMWRSVSAL
jgi:hypothetical protein